MLLRVLNLPHDRPWRSRSLVACSLLLAPMGVGVRIPDDSTEAVPMEMTNTESGEKVTSLRFGAGGGRYGRAVHAERIISLGYDSCTGYPLTERFDAEFRFEDEYSDYGGELDVQVSKSTHLGMRGGWITEAVRYVNTSLDPVLVDSLFSNQYFDSTETSIYINPYVAFEHRTWGAGFGLVYSDGDLWTEGAREYTDLDDASLYPTGHIRLGRLDQVYMSASLWEGVPIYSGGGVFTYGIGLRPVQPLGFWVGFTSGGPYTERNFLLRADADIGRHLNLGVNARLKSDVDEAFQPSFSEYGLSFTLGFRFYRD